MAEATKIHDIHQPPSSQITLDELLREGARRLLQSAIEQEVAAYIDAHAVRARCNKTTRGSAKRDHLS